MKLQKSIFTFTVVAALGGLTACNTASVTGPGEKGPVPESTTPTDESGIPLIEWSALGTTADTVKIYVSSSNTQASDMNDGLSADKPMKTLAMAKKKLRYGKPDWLMLKQGDTFNETLSGVYGGQSIDAPMVITSYCDDNDKTKCGLRPSVIADTGLEFQNARTQSIQFVAIVGLHFKTASYMGNENQTDAGFTAIVAVYKNGTGILIEDCFIEKFRRGIFFYTDGDPKATFIQDVVVRRNAIVDTWTDATPLNATAYNVYGFDRKSNAISISGVGGNTLIEENLFDHNGYNEARPAALKMGHNSTIARRGGTFGAGFVVRRNLFFRGGQEGINMENGGQASDNLFIEIPTPISQGMKHQDAYIKDGNKDIWMYSSIPSIITNNVVMESTRSDAWADGSGINVFKPDAKGRIEGNVVANRTSTTGGTPSGIACDDPVNSNAERTPDDGDCSKISIKDNVIANWPAGFTIDGKVIAPVSTASALVDATRDVESYMASLKLSSDKMAFLARARLQSKAGWDKRFMAPAVNAHIREGLQAK